ncbi:PH domain-containing protein [Ilumatobacter sp.]|uniref:PH domain-containing protein n=1 Tax=Ilumatobacter sp. TaxID=1967498 RepID=UPI003B52B041
MTNDGGGEFGEVRNDPIASAHLPRLDDVEFEPLHPLYLRLRLLGALAAAVVVVAVVVAAVAATRAPVVPAIAIGLLALVLVASSAVVAALEVRSMGYAVRELDVSARRGLLNRTVRTAPYARVQDVGIDRGPIERRLGLATLQLRTAGGSISVPGMSLDTAERLKALVVDRAGELAAAEATDDESGHDATPHEASAHEASAHEAMPPVPPPPPIAGPPPPPPPPPTSRSPEADG